MGKKTLSLLLAAGVAIGFGGGWLVGVGKSIALQQKIAEVKNAYPVLAESFISGTVESISGQLIQFKVFNNNPLDDSPRHREIAVSDSTKIYRYVQKSEEQIRKDWAEYKAKVNASETGQNLLPPVPVARIEVSLGGLKTGDFLDVEAGHIIGNETRIEAVKITARETAPVNSQ